jgi:hypothetical protein
MLATKDAHGLYQQYGFTQIAEPEMLMQKWQPNVYQVKGSDKHDELKQLAGENG